MATEATISAVDDKYSTPSYTLDLAEMLEPYLAEVQTGGILHLCNGGSCSWREYAQHALDAAHAAVSHFWQKQSIPFSSIPSPPSS